MIYTDSSKTVFTVFLSLPLIFFIKLDYSVCLTGSVLAIKSYFLYNDTNAKLLPAGTVVVKKFFSATSVFLPGHEITTQTATQYWLADTDTKVSVEILFEEIILSELIAIVAVGVIWLVDGFIIYLFIFCVRVIILGVA